MDNATNLVFSPVSRFAPGNSAASSASTSQTRGRVLIVEDNPINQKVAVILISKLGFLVDVAAHGAEALDMVRDQDYTLILMDCQMPVMDGFEATRAIRALQTPIAQVPIIAVTANVMEGQRDKCLAAGMNDYLPKPINKEVLGETVDKWIPPVNGPKIDSVQALTA